MWRCCNCKSSTFRKDEITRRYVVLDENGNIKRNTKPVELIEQIICDECGNYSDNIEDIAEWEE